MNGNNGKIAAFVVAVIIVIGGIVLATNSKEDQKPAGNTSDNSTSQETQKPAATDTDTTTSQISTITYTDDGFSPDSQSVKAGSKVTVKNDSSIALQFDSDPHPQHTDNPELNIGNIDPGESETITVTTTGSHGYHNHLNAADTGILTVE